MLAGLQPGIAHGSRNTQLVHLNRDHFNRRRTIVVNIYNKKIKIGSGRSPRNNFIFKTRKQTEFL